MPPAPSKIETLTTLTFELKLVVGLLTVDWRDVVVVVEV